MKICKYMSFITLAIIVVIANSCKDDPEYTNISMKKNITNVQPMTGIVFWCDNDNSNSDAISLEFSYLEFDKIVITQGVYDWRYIESILRDVASRNHQAIFRFRYTYPGKETSVPAYIKARDDYHETIGLSEGLTTSFPDWTCPELERFTKEFHTKFAEKYDKDPRLAFLQVGFGLWAEYHIYDGPFILGKTFPGKAFQEEFFYHLGETYKTLLWSVSIDSYDNTYSPLEEKPEIINTIKFGLFDDSFMHETHDDYNKTMWDNFGRDRYMIAPCGGEFSYYTDYDQEHVLDLPNGPYGISWETFAGDYHISYMIGNDQPAYQSFERIKQASMATGYRFKVKKFDISGNTATIEIENTGIAPIYYDAYPAINGSRSKESLKELQPGTSKVFTISDTGSGSDLTIECDHILPGQTIQYEADL